MEAVFDMATRERIASDILGQTVHHGDALPCRFAELHSRKSGPRDMRVGLEPGAAGELPTFYCFHASCQASWAPLNKELRRRIWFAERGRDPDKGSAWDNGVRPEPRVQYTKAKFDYSKLASMERMDWRVNNAWFMERSPVAVATVGAVDFAEAIFRPGEKMLVFDKFASQGQFGVWVGRGGYRLGPRPGIDPTPSALPGGGPEGIWYLCNPVDGRWYPNPRSPLVEGRIQMSRRSQESVTSWRYLVLECDHKEKACPCKDCKGRDNPRIHELWLNFLAQLKLPIAAIYTSGGKSVHALVRVDAETKTHWDRFKHTIIEPMVVHGADPAAITAVRLTRLPSCMRGDQLQKLLYLNPSPDMEGVAIGSGGNHCV